MGVPQDVHDRVSMELARRVAEGLASHPEWIGFARENLARWMERNRDAPGLLRCYEEWRSLLALPHGEIARRLTAETDEGDRLRRNSPFAGVVPPAEVWAIKRRARDEARAT